MSQDEAVYRNAKVACDSCDTWNAIRYQVGRGGQMFACVKCGKVAVRAPRVPVLVKESTEPSRPWQLSETDKRFLRRGLRITPE